MKQKKLPAIEKLPYNAIIITAHAFSILQGGMIMDFRKAQNWRDILMITGFVVMLGAYIYEPLIFVGAVLMCSCLIPHFFFYRCPHCGKLLGREAGKYCQHCGKELE